MCWMLKSIWNAWDGNLCAHVKEREVVRATLIHGKYHILYNVPAMVSFNVITTNLSYFGKTKPLLIQKYINNQQMHFFYSMMYCIHNIPTHIFWPLFWPRTVETVPPSTPNRWHTSQILWIKTHSITALIITLQTLTILTPTILIIIHS